MTLNNKDMALSVAFSHDGQWLASGSWDKTIRLWNLNQPNAIHSILSGHENRIDTVAFSPDRRWLASGSEDNTIRLWDLSQPTTRPIILRHDSFVRSVAFSPNGKWLASGSYDGTIRLWQWRTSELADMVCQKVRRNLNQAEWQQYLGKDEPYRPTCPNLPAGK